MMKMKILIYTIFFLKIFFFFIKHILCTVYIILFPELLHL